LLSFTRLVSLDIIGEESYLNGLTFKIFLENESYLSRQKMKLIYSKESLLSLILRSDGIFCEVASNFARGLSEAKDRAVTTMMIMILDIIVNFLEVGLDEF